LARRLRITLNTIFQGAWGLLLGRSSGQDDVLYGTTVSGRPADLPGVEGMVGLFINTVPVRLRLPAEEAIAVWLQHLHAEQARRLPFEYSPLVQIRRWSELPAGTPLFRTLLVFENFPSARPGEGSSARSGSLQGQRQGRQGAQQTDHPLTLAVLPQR